MKAYTDIERSKKLAKILPLESADYTRLGENEDNVLTRTYFESCSSELKEWIGKDKMYPCWSLAALLSILPKKYYPIKDHETNLILGKPKDKWCVLYWDTTGMQDGEQTLGDNPVDACYEMVLKLHELKML